MDIYDLRQLLSRGRTVYDLPLRVAYYARVSTEKDGQRHSLEAQVGYYEEMIRAQPNWVFAGGYVDAGLSGTGIQRRPRFLEMIRDAEEGRFDFILTKEISRFSRSTLDSIRYTRQLLGCGVGVLFQSDNINTLMPDAELRLTILAGIAQDEVRKISERVRFGFRRAMEQGVVLGNDNIWGYRKEGGRLTIHEEQAEMVRLIFRLYANEGLGIRRVAQRLTEMGYRNSKGRPFSFSSVRGILTNPKYKGWYCGGKTSRYDFLDHRRKHFDREDWIMYPDETRVPAIVSPDLWDKANRQLLARGEGQGGERTPSRARYPYSGKIRCGEHGCLCHRGLYRNTGGAREFWRCSQGNTGDNRCKGISLYSTEMDGVLRRRMDEMGVELSGLAEGLLSLYFRASDGQRRGGAERERARLERCRNQLLELKQEGLVTEGELERQEREIRARMEQLEGREEEGVLPDPKSLRRGLEEAVRFPRGLSFPVVDALMEGAVITGESSRSRPSVRIRWRGGEEEGFSFLRQRGKPSVCCGPYI